MGPVQSARRTLPITERGLRSARRCHQRHGETPTAVNHVWAYDFVFDTCADGRILKCLTVIDEFTRECLAIDVAAGSGPAA